MGRSKDLATGETRFVNTSGDTMTGNLAINNASGSQVTLHRTDTTIANDDLYGQIILSGDDADTNSSGTRGYIRGRSQGSGGGLKMEFGTAGGGVAMGSDPRMTINADGIVTKPNHPGFQVSGNFGWRDYGSTYTEVVDWRSNQSGYYNSGMFSNSTGRATAPVAGTYVFNFVAYTNNSGEVSHYGYPAINGSQFGDAIMLHTNNHGTYPDHTVAGSYQMSLGANDYVSVFWRHDLYGYHTHFSGHLIG